MNHLYFMRVALNSLATNKPVVLSFPIKLEFRSVGFCKGRKTREPEEKILGARRKTNNKLNPHDAGSGNRTWATLVEASALATTILSLSLGLIPSHFASLYSLGGRQLDSQKGLKSSPSVHRQTHYVLCTPPINGWLKCSWCYRKYNIMPIYLSAFPLSWSSAL